MRITRTIVPATPMGRRAFLAGGLATGGAALLSGCTTNKALGRSSFTPFYDIEDDIRIGREEYPKLVQQFGGAYDDPKLQAYVDGLGKQLARNTEYPQLPYTFTVADTPIVNAFALPGGFITVTRGLVSMASSEAELAGVLSHEIGHVNARHTAERLSQAQAAQIGLFGLSIVGAVFGVPGEAFRLAEQGVAAYIQSYSRQQEFEADQLAVRYMSRGGYDPQAMVGFLETLQQQSVVEARIKGLPEGQIDQFNVMSTHPRTVDRVQEAIRLAKEVDVPATRVARHEYLNEIDGMVFGDSPKNGIVHGNRFIHPELGFKFEVPPDFVLFNNPDKVIARHPNDTVIVFDGQGIATTGLSMTDYVRAHWASKFTVNDLTPVDINGLPAATGYVMARTNGGSRRIRLVAVRFDADTVYRFQFVMPPDRVAEMNLPLRETTYSFKRLTETERAAITPMHLDVTVSKPGDTVESLSRNLPYGKYNPDYFRLLNDMGDGERLAPGRRIKVVKGRIV